MSLSVAYRRFFIFRNSLYNEGKCSILALKNAGSLVAVGIPAFSDSDKKRRENYGIKGRKIVEKPLALPLRLVL